MGVTSKPVAAPKPSAGTSSRTVKDGSLYYVYASSAGKDPDANIQILEKDSTTDKFVASLNKDQVIILAGAPSPSAGLDDTDETKKWFQNLDAAAVGSLKVDDSADQKIESFDFEFTQPWPLIFSSASDVLLFTFGASPVVDREAGNRIPVPGIDTAGQILTCGLDFSRYTEITNTRIKDLFTNANVSTNSVPSAILPLEATLPTPGAGDEPRRNALWYVPSSDQRVTVRLQFQVPIFEPLQDLLGASLKGLNIQSTDVIYRNSMLLAATENGQQPMFQGEISFAIQCSVKGNAKDAPEVSMMAGVQFYPSETSLTLMFLSKDPLTGILVWLASLIDEENLESFVTGILNKTEKGTKVLPDFNLRRMKIGLSTIDDVENPKLSSVSFDIEVTASLGGSSKDKPVVFLISYNWNGFAGSFGNLAGQLWNDFESSLDWDLMPLTESWTTLQPLTPSPATSISFVDLIPTEKVLNIPDTLPSEITLAYLSLSDDSFNIRCAITANPPTPGTVPQPYLGEVVLDASFTWGSSSSFALEVAVNAAIEPSENASVMEPAVLAGSLKYDSAAKSWGMEASLMGLYASTLVDFFDQDAKDHVGPLIESISIEELSVAYKYVAADQGKSKSSEFTIVGDLRIASLSLGLDFKHDDQGFSFVATLNPGTENATIGEVIASTLGSSVELPGFVANTVLAGENKDAFTLSVDKKKTADGKAESFQFLAQIRIADIRIDFAQLHSTAWPATAPSKRLVKVGIGGFSNVKIDIPLIGTIVQPLDELYFLWVQDPPTRQPTPGQQAGLTRIDVALLNSGLQDPIRLQDKIKPDQQKDTDLLAPAGSLFAVVVRSNTGEPSCLLSYSFMPQKASSTTRSQQDAEEDDSGPSAQAPYKKMTGPLSISNVGLKYKEKKLAIMFDATFELGPVGFSLLGFSLATEFETLDKFPVITPDIQGLATSFERRPLTISGVIRHVNTDKMDYFAGGLVVGWVPYQFQAAGFYGVIIPTGGGEFRTIFVFSKLNGPLFTLGFAEVTSICGGFGYNSTVRVPTIDEVYAFPFIDSQNLSGDDSAMAVLSKIIDPSPTGWFQPRDKVYWGAIGLKVGAFQMLSVDSVVVVEFGNSIKLGIFAVAVADIPTLKSSWKLAHVELGIAAVVDFDYGSLKIEAQLSPRSYILDQNCHLTGGFALYYWFDAPHADQSLVGQFVFTLGGYHQAYRVPIGYPTPPRLGISWSLGGGLKISGEAFFAITPKACMAGGRLHASFSAGPLSAWFDAFADFLINYKPFYFNMSAGISVGVGFSIDIWFIHIRISVEIGAQLYLWGPPVAGRVHVDFWIVGFDINFGQSPQQDDAVDLAEFYMLVLQTSTTAASVASAGKALLTQGESSDDKAQLSSTTRPKNEAHNFLAQSGLLNPDDKPEREQNEIWTVRAGSFSFVVECKMAINAVKSDAAKDNILTYGDIFSRPMKLQSAMTSTLVIQVKQDGMTDVDDGWQYDKYLKSVPTGLWAKYDKKTDPRVSGNNVGELLNGNDGAITLMMGVQITAPKPTMSPDPFPAYKVDDADLQSLPAEKAFPEFGNADTGSAPTKANTDVAQQFEDVLATWTKPTLGTGDDGQQGFVSILAETLKWPSGSKLKEIASIPERLGKGFKNMYVAAPLLTTA
ncbi:hypothetical protein CDD81_5964 [Ophiocordyceps australis]|uniref:DUF6603 domain-containing protein n=1 Tax=Ophiocordyceps australis TaxID=1399860 RepID=A0A2C5YHR8_9HYPO|nr:hypothetical protein CDD81_5964 [Ophiocordyceps australis]